MRILLLILILMSSLFTKAQSHLPIDTWGYTQWHPFMPSTLFDGGNQNQKWQLKQYASLSAGYIFLNGGVSFLSAPFGLALVHPLTKNISAFASVSAAPVIFSVNRLYTDPVINPSNPGNNFSRPYGLGLNARVEGGLIYTNDAKTFSISGSVGIERGSYPVYPSGKPNTKKQ